MTSKKSALKNTAMPPPDDQNFRLIFEGHSAVMLLIEPITGFILDANQAAVDFYGYSKSKLCGMSISEINTTPPELVALERQKAFKEERNYFVFPHRLASGEERRVEVYSSPINLQDKPVLFSIIHDITGCTQAEETLQRTLDELEQRVAERTQELQTEIAECKQTEAALLESEARYRRLADHAPDIIFRYDIHPTMKLAYINPAVQSITGYTPEDCYANPLLMMNMIHADDMNLMAGHMQSLTPPDEPLAARWIGKDGVVRWMESRIVPLHDADGQLVAVEGITRDITAHKQLEDKIASAKARLEMVVTSSTVMLYASQAYGDFDATYISGNIGAITGYTREDFLSKGFLANHIHPEDAPKVFEKVPVLFEQNHYEQEYRFLFKDGTYHWMYDELTLTRDESGNPLEIIGTWADVNERKQAEERLRESEEKYRVIFNNEIYAICIFDLETLKLLDVNEAYVRLYGYSREELLSGMTVHDITAEQQVSDSAIAQAAREGTTIIPTRYHRKKDGTVFPTELVAGPYVWQGRKVMFVLLHDITERKQAEEALQKSQALLNATGRMAHVGGWEIDLLAQKLTWTAEVYRIHEVEADFIPDLNTAINFYAPESRPVIEQAVQQAIEQGKPFDMQLQIITARENMLWVHAIGQAERQDGKTLRVFGTFQDVTERKQVEDQLREAEAKYRDIFENSIEGIYQSTPDGHYINVNAAMARILGYETPEEMIAYVGNQVTVRVYANPGRHAEFTRILGQAGVINDFEIENRRKDGSIIWTRTSARVIRDANGAALYYEGFLEDITARKQAEDALLEKEIQYRNLADSGIALIWRAGTDKLCNYFNLPWLKFTGRTLEQEMGNGWTEGVHPDDFDRCLEIYTTAFDKREPFDMDYRLRHVSGEYRWIQDLGTPNYNSNGEFVGYIGHCFDITARKYAEDKFRMLFELSPIGLAMVDNGTGEFLEVNESILRATGYTKDEFLKLSYWEITPREYEAQEMKQLQDLKETGRFGPNEKEYVRKDGTRYPLSISGVLFVDQNGKEVVWGIIEDITERKRAEEMLRQHAAYLAALHETSLGLINRLNLTDLLTSIVTRAALLVGTSHGYLYVANQEGTHLEVRASTGIFADYIGFQLKFGEGLAGQVWQTGQPMQVEDYTHWQHRVASLEHADLRAIAAVPLKSGARVIGIIGVGQIDSDTRFSDADIEILLRFAEMASLALDNANLYETLQHDITERKRAEAELRRAKETLEITHNELQQSFAREQNMARTDSLTGINNRNSLFELAEREFEIAKRYHPPLSILMFDIDDFKHINDAFGHAIGDQALKKITQVVCDKLRSADVVGRYGGDEFIILMPHTSTQEALSLAERIHASVASLSMKADNGTFSVTISLGIAQTIHDAAQPDTVESLFLRADKALYAAKQAGRNRTVIFDPNGTGAV